MFSRLAYFLFFQLIGGAIGWWQEGVWGALVGAGFAAWGWFALDLWRGTRVLRWLRMGDLSSVPQLRGMWGEAADRARRLLRQAQAQVGKSQARLQEVLAALQATPNGVVLLDAQGRIEWCNQIAAAYFGLDVQRDLMQFIGNLVRAPEFSAYWTAQDFSHDVILQGRDSTPAHPVRLSVATLSLCRWTHAAAGARL